MIKSKLIDEEDTVKLAAIKLMCQMHNNKEISVVDIQELIHALQVGIISSSNLSYVSNSLSILYQTIIHPYLSSLNQFKVKVGFTESLQDIAQTIFESV
jgi:hypothetical protein